MGVHIAAVHMALCILDVPSAVNVVQCNVAVIVHTTAVKIGALYIIVTDIFL
jgi:hypothetical protein